MTDRILYGHINLDALKDEAKSLLTAAKAGDKDALIRVKPYFKDSKSAKLTQIQLVIAREYVFDSWSKIKSYLELRDEAMAAQMETLKLQQRVRATMPGYKEEKEGALYCSFCGKSQYEVVKLISGPSVWICNECVELSVDIIGKEQDS